jgi:hypothetical protein
MKKAKLRGVIDSLGRYVPDVPLAPPPVPQQHAPAGSRRVRRDAYKAAQVDARRARQKARAARRGPLSVEILKTRAK